MPIRKKYIWPALLLVCGVFFVWGPVHSAEFDIPLEKLGTTKSVGQWLNAARQGSAIAQYMMGRHYEEGQGVPKDYTKAAQWYAKSAKQGMKDADAILGLFFLSGKGVPQSSARGIALLKKSAQMGNIRARYHLGVAYLEGKHIKKDLVRGYMWLDLAAYIPRTPESFKAKEKMQELRPLLSKKEIRAALKMAKIYK